MSSKTPKVTLLQRIQQPFGFRKTYNFTLYIILCGALLGFTLSRLMYLSFDNIFCNPNSKVGSALPGECYYYKQRSGKIGIMLHLSTVLPAGILVVLQFLPIIRYKWLLVHRINGYIVIVLSVLSTVGVFIVLKFVLGGMVDVQTVPAFASILFLGSKGLALWNIKKLQIEQHRAWMIRAWSVAGYIITMRIISLLMSLVISSTARKPFSAIPCNVIDYIFAGNTSQVLGSYPSCSPYYSGQNPDQHAIVQADMGTGRADQLVAAFNSTFSTGSWLALAIHCIGAEVYLRLTPAEASRLRKISYQKQLEAGMQDPGNGGLTVQRLGDAEPWGVTGSEGSIRPLH